MNELIYNPKHCLLAKFHKLASGKWKPILLHLIERKVDRFNSILRHIPSISRKVLTEQLRALEKDRLIKREVIKSKEPKIVIYSLTKKGAELRRILDQMVDWSIDYFGEVGNEEFMNVYRKVYKDKQNKPTSKHFGKSAA
jgi:DNA-binding HxlR family transcriptional regulator